MLKKEHKILVVVSPEPAERKRLLSRLAVRLGFALIPSDAAKIISNDIYGIDLATAYFVFCSSYNFRGAVLTNQRLYEMAARGLCVAVGPFASLMGISQGDLTDTPMADAGSVTGAAQPVAISVRNPAGRTSFQYSFSTLDTSFEQFGAALGQALETAQNAERTSALRVQEALGKTSVAFCYPGEISSKLAASWLHVDTDLDTQSRWFILAGDGVYVTLYLVGEELFSCQTQMRAESLEQLLQSCTPGAIVDLNEG